MPSAIMALITSSLLALQRDLHLHTLRYRDDHQRLEQRLKLYRRLKADMIAGRLDEQHGPESMRQAEADIRALFNSLDRLLDRSRTLRAEIEMLGGDLSEATTKGPLTPVQARKRADRDNDRRRRISDLQAAKNNQVATKNRQTAAVRAKLGR